MNKSQKLFSKISENISLRISKDEEADRDKI
jgi:hypothetical protein